VKLLLGKSSVSWLALLLVLGGWCLNTSVSGSPLGSGMTDRPLNSSPSEQPGCDNPDLLCVSGSSLTLPSAGMSGTIQTDNSSRSSPFQLGGAPVHVVSPNERSLAASRFTTASVNRQEHKVSTHLFKSVLTL